MQLVSVIVATPYGAHMRADVLNENSPDVVAEYPGNVAEAFLANCEAFPTMPENRCPHHIFLTEADYALLDADPKYEGFIYSAELVTVNSVVELCELLGHV